MFDHVTIRASDRDASQRFYGTVLSALGIEQTYSDEHFAEWNDFSLVQASDSKPATRRLHVAFAAADRAHVDEFWRLGIAAGYRDDGSPGLRAIYGDDYYGGFLLDPDGNSAEAVHNDTVSAGTGIDHLWIRVGDVEASRRFYETVAPFTGFVSRHVSDGYASFRGSGASFSVVTGAPTANLHLAFAARSNATVDAFHDAALSAGHRDNGAPGERPVYHPGYYGAFVLDPDGNNVEVVHHDRK